MSRTISRGNNLIFHTDPGGQTIRAGKWVDVTKSYPDGINVSPFYTIRVFGGNRVVSEGPVTFKLIMKIDQVSFLMLDTITVSPGEQFTKTYDVPGTGLAIKAEADVGGGIDAVDVAVFGYKF
ncbi:hypothetical protein [Halobacillus litoralis]|uniref:Uncharacterized protein n=1 Tax=Halobacillus litoralis TaxID=45668 RepID=A0A410ME73_9BACI|nr:hypothetical protein [Halobacillus litoralis]QAS52998.1 hypothetical protein HLI_12750 [Halobacillus litoralis]